MGYHVARALAARGTLVVHYHSSAQEAAKTAEELARATASPSTPPARTSAASRVKAMVVGTLAKFCRIDVLANLRAIWNRKSLEEVTAADVQSHFEANTLGIFSLASISAWPWSSSPRRMHRRTRRLGRCRPYVDTPPISRARPSSRG